MRVSLRVIGVISVVGLLAAVGVGPTGASVAPSPRTISPPPPGAWFSAVGAADTAHLWAVGGYQTSGSFNERSLVVRFDGSSWTTVPAPDIGRLLDVAVIDDGDVWAMGSERLLHWDGLSWTSYKGPAPKIGSYSGISATATDDVWVSGVRPGRMLGPHYQGWATLTGHWDGVGWTREPSLTPRHRSYNLEGIVAISPDNAWAAGYVDAGGDHDHTLVLHWDGAWHRLPSPNPNRLNVVWGVGDDGGVGAWALGHTLASGHLRAMFIHCAGRCRLVRPTNDVHWTPTAADATSRDDVWAIGSEPTSNIATAHWNGSRWRLSIRPNDRYDRQFLDVVALAPDDVWAVGQRNTKNGPTPLVERWDGSQWLIVHVPDTWS